MADVSGLVEEHIVNQGEEKAHIETPMRADVEHIQALASCFAHSNQFGAKMFCKNAVRYIRTLSIAETQYNAMERNIATLNGVKSKLTDPEKAQKTQKNVAKNFYLSLSTAGLRAQCRVLAVDYDSYNTQEQIIEELVKRHVDLMTA